MNTQHLETPTDLEAEAQQRARDAARAELGLTEAEVSTPPSVQGEETLNTQIQTKTPGFGFHRRRTSAVLKGAEELKKLDFDSVLTILREESRKRTRRKHFGIGIFLSLAVLFVVLAIFTHDKSLLHSMGHWVSLITIGAAASQRHKSAAVAIATFDNVRAVGPLAEALEFQDKVVSQAAAQKLIELLPKMKASDSALLSLEQRQFLTRALRGKNTALILAILLAYEQVGDTGAISEVEKLAAGHGNGGRDPKVVAAAQECLPALRQSAERQQVGAQLLRAADGNQTPSDVLLRPSMPHASTDPADQLLRPSDTIA